MPQARSINGSCPVRTVAAITASLLQNPLKGGTPESASRAMTIEANVIFIEWRSPPISPMNLESTACKMAPAARKAAALKIACVIRWKIPALRPVTNSDAKPPAPMPSIM